MAAFDTGIRFHGFAPQTPQHGGCRFERNAKDIADLIGIDLRVFTATEDHGLEPFMHRHLAVFEYGANLNGKRFAAVVAFVGMQAGALTLQSAYATGTAAMRANGTVRPHLLFNKFIRCFFIPEFLRVLRIHRYTCTNDVVT